MAYNDDDRDIYTADDMADHDLVVGQYVEVESAVPTTLPTWLPRQASESLQAYGTRALLFLLQFSCTAPLSDDDLEQAERAGQLAVASPLMADVARAKISQTRHVIASILRGRRADIVATVARTPVTLTSPPNEGPMAPLLDRPLVRPPSGTKVQVQS